MLLDNIRIDILPARAGDCMIIDFVKEDYRILIDGGYRDTYNKYLKKKLVELSEQGKKINLLVITHIDSDHIGGILALLQENGSALSPAIIEIDEVWYNAFFHMYTEVDPSGVIPYTLKSVLKASVAETTQISGEKDISVSQGNTVARLLREGGYNWNTLWNGNAVSVSCGEYKQLTKNIGCRLLNPGETELEDLAKMWVKKLKGTLKNVVLNQDILISEAFESFFSYNEQFRSDVEKKNISFTFEQSEETVDWNLWKDEWSDYIDESKTNRSSIAFILEYEGKRLLFPGDCPIQLFSDKLPTKVDVVKLPHHGSEKNINKEFIRETEVEYFILSTDGKRQEHPGKVVIANILQGKFEEPRLLINYDIPMLKDIDILVRDEYD